MIKFIVSLSVPIFVNDKRSEISAFGVPTIAISNCRRYEPHSISIVIIILCVHILLICNVHKRVNFFPSEAHMNGIKYTYLIFDPWNFFYMMLDDALLCIYVRLSTLKLNCFEMHNGIINIEKLFKKKVHPKLQTAWYLTMDFVAFCGFLCFSWFGFHHQPTQSPTANTQFDVIAI